MKTTSFSRPVLDTLRLTAGADSKDLGKEEYLSLLSQDLANYSLTHLIDRHFGGKCAKAGDASSARSCGGHQGRLTVARKRGKHLG